jgi:hypothetical protein
LEKRLLLETTLFQEDTTPEALNALLDQLEVPSAPFSPEEEWARFQQAHPEHFPSRRPRRAPLWAAAACLILAVVLPAAGSFFHASEPSAVTTSAISQPEEARAILYRLAGLSPAAGTPLRAELPFDGVLSDGLARLPLEAELYPLPFYSSDNPLSIEDGSIVNDPEIREAP